MIAASARRVHASSEAKVDCCVESGGIAEKPIRKVRAVRCALGAVPLSEQARTARRNSARGKRRIIRGHNNAKTAIAQVQRRPFAHLPRARARFQLPQLLWPEVRIAGGPSGGSGSFIGLCGYPGLMSGGKGSFGVTSGPDGGSGM
jgi:hypothetical protein